MQIPPAGFIEAALDALPNEDPDVTTRKKRELHVAIGDRATTDFSDGYLLGVKVSEILAETQFRPAPDGGKAK